jgi:hypothetical protein
VRVRRSSDVEEAQPIPVDSDVIEVVRMVRDQEVQTVNFAPFERRRNRGRSGDSGQGEKEVGSTGGEFSGPSIYSRFTIEQQRQLLKWRLECCGNMKRVEAIFEGKTHRPGAMATAMIEQLMIELRRIFVEPQDAAGIDRLPDVFFKPNLKLRDQCISRNYFYERPDIPVPDDDALSDTDD